MRENVLLFDQEIRAAGAKTVLYMTWARKHAPEKQKVLSEAYKSIGREISAVVVPVGDVWWRFIAKHDSLALHDKDQSHPTRAGSYLAACVFLATLFGKSPLGIKSPVSGVDADEVILLQKSI
jgi:hypothetical protein